MKRLAIGAVIALALIGVGQVAGATTPKTALIVGDSLTYESRFQLATRFSTRAGWTQHTRSVIGSAPCDWIPYIASDLATYQPSVVGLLTAGNTGGLSTCMTAPNGTPEFAAQYRADLATIFQMVTATGARVVFFSAPPFTNVARNADAKTITTIATQLAYQYHGVSIAGSVRTALSINGLYTDTKLCLTTETLEPGCVNGRIAIRTLPGFVDSGLHLCPTGLPAGIFGICPTYSSGEYRFARAMANSLITPPPPKLP